ncbi:uncharacterized protein LOC62_07G008897 [Vanrija pseudolonga]|uniref:Uncharacterized protein n=1 Tax=Vanrija pseudolonga TaxID=143232 RepID=A0AAF0YET8_9TREE|nr:hypothetical protein LOC62_07G008897 [Vanrija pseudolonga]
MRGRLAAYSSSFGPSAAVNLSGGATNNFTNFGAAQYNIVHGSSLQTQATPGVGHALTPNKPSPFTLQTQSAAPAAGYGPNAASGGSPQTFTATDDSMEVIDDSSDEDVIQFLQHAPPNTKWADHKSLHSTAIFATAPKAAPTAKDDLQKKIFSPGPGRSISFFLDAGCAPRLPEMFKVEGGVNVAPEDAQFLVFNVHSAADLTQEQKAFIRAQPMMTFVVTQGWVLQCIAEGRLGDVHKAHLAI